MSATVYILLFIHFCQERKKSSNFNFGKLASLDLPVEDMPLVCA